MGWYSKALASVFPGYSVKRINAMQITAAYESAKPSRTHKPRRESRGPNTPVIESAATLREQGRYLEQNNDIAKGALDILVNRTVGLGIVPEFMVENTNGDLHDEVNEQLSELYEEWTKRPEVTWLYDETTAQRLAARTYFRDGEYLCQHLLGKSRGLDHGTRVPYSYEMIEPDALPMGYNNESPRIISGISVNGWGRPTAYNLLKNDPNSGSLYARMSDETRAIPAKMMSHLSLVHRIKQYRGVSVFAVVLKRLQDIDEIDETERVAARMAAAMAVVIKKGDATLYNTPDDDTEYREMQFEPGMILDDLLPGEEIQSIVSNRPNNQLIPFKGDQYRAAAAGLGVGGSSLSKRYEGNYSSQRQELVEQHDHYGVMWKYLVERGERPKMENFIEMAVMSGAVKLPADVRKDSLKSVDFSRPAMPWIQPLQEANAWGKLREDRIESTSEIIRSRGKSPRKVKKQIEREDRENAAKSETGSSEETDEK